MEIAGELAVSAFEDLWRQMVTDAPQRFWRQIRYGAVAFVSEIPAPPMNGVFVFRPDVDLQDVRALLLEVAQANFPFCLQARPSLRETLSPIADELGMMSVNDVPLMVLDDPSVLRQALQVDGLTVRALTEDEHATHENLLAAGFGMPVELAQAMMEYLGGAAGIREFVGEVSGTAVTTALTVPTTHDSVGVFNVATPPDLQRRGYGAAVTAGAVLDKLDHGGTFAWLQSSAAGYPVYQRLGFRLVESWPMWVALPTTSATSDDADN